MEKETARLQCVSLDSRQTGLDPVSDKGRIQVFVPLVGNARQQHSRHGNK